MIRYLIKNNIKLMSRSMINVLLIIVGPLILIAVLSSAFDDLMKSYEEGSIRAGYRIEGNSMTNETVKAMRDVAAENDITFIAFSSGDPETLIRENDISAFVVFGDDDYTVYQDKDMIEAGKVMEYFVSSFYKRAADAVATQQMAAQGSAVPEEGSIELKVEYPEFISAIDSLDYYGIVEIVFFGWSGIVCGAALFFNEKKYRIPKKFIVSDISEAKLYLGKFIPLSVVVGLGTIISAALSVLLFGVHWGVPLLSALIIFLSAMASTAFGLMVHSIFDNVVVTIIVVWIAVWFAGFYGGSFETYMFSSHPMSIKKLSPVYHINRALAELSCMGKSDHVADALIYIAGIVLVCSCIAVMAGMIRRRGKA